MKKENIYIDLSKCSEEQQKHIFSLLPEPEVDLDYEISIKYYFLHLDIYKWYVDRKAAIFDKTELTYPDFIKLFEGEKEIQDLTAQLQADKAELLEALEKLKTEKKDLLILLYDCKIVIDMVRQTHGFIGASEQLYNEIESLIQKHKQ